MEQSLEKDIRALHIITNAGFADEVVAIARETGASGATIMSGRGEGPRYEVFMGITLDSEKDLVLCITEKAVAQKAMQAINEKAGRKTPAHSICYTTPIDQMIGVSFTPR